MSRFHLSRWITVYPAQRAALLLFSSALLVFRRLRRQLGYPLLLSLVILVNPLSTLPASAAMAPPPKLPNPQGSSTLQKFLQQLTPVHSGSPVKLTPGDAHLWKEQPQQKQPASPPSAEPARMKPVSQSISIQTTGGTASPASTSPSTATSAQSSTPAPGNGKNALNAGNTEIRLVGNDAHGKPLLEIIIPAGALDASAATTESGGVPQGHLTLTLSELHGHYVAETRLLGYFQVQVTDDAGHHVHGLKLTQPATVIYHYQPHELADFGVDSSSLILVWTDLLVRAEQAEGTATSKQGTLTKGDPTANLVSPMSNGAAAQTLTAQTMTFDASTLAVTSDQPEDQSPPAPHVASVSGNSGQLGYSYPIQVAPGPPGTQPVLTLTYSSGNTNSRHSPLSPAGFVGEGWSLQLASISASKTPSTSAGGAKTWYSIAGVDGVSDRMLDPDNGNDTQTFETEHLSHLKIQKVQANNQPCFHVYDTDGNYYELGCTADSLQFYTTADGTRHNYSWNLDKLIPASDNPGADNRQMTVTYVQDKNTLNGHTSVRDSAIKQIIYGNGTRAGTVNFFYRGPASIDDSAVTANYGSDYTCSNPPATQTPKLRCDDPLDRDSGLKKPLVMSTLTLTSIKTYVGDASSTTHLYYSYTFTYQDTAFSACTDGTTGTKAYCAGSHLLTKITPAISQSGTTHTLPSVTFAYTDGLDDTYIDTTHQVNGDPYETKTSWHYLNHYMDLSNGVGATIVYQTAYGNTHGTPLASDGDNRYDALFCSKHSTCTGDFTRPDEKQWATQVVTSLTNSGKDSSASDLAPATTTYQYWLTHTADSCPKDSSGMDDCVRDTWMPADDSDWQDFYDEEYRGFAQVLITSPAGDLMVQKYASTAGWSSPQSAVQNYTSGSLMEEDVYQGGSADPNKLIKKTVNVYAGDGNNGNDKNACNFNFTDTVYKPCETLLQSQTITTYEQTGAGNTSAPWVTHTFTYDDYNGTNGLGDYHQPPASGAYGNKLTEVITSSNAPTITKKWSYDTTDTTINGNVYYNVHSVVHSETVDASGHTWQCQDTTYDEGAPTSPAAGYATTVKTYTNCANQSASVITTYTGYDINGNTVATVDGVGAATPSLYTSAGCTPDPNDPVKFKSSAWGKTTYTSCTKYEATGSLPTDTWNAFSQHTITAYDPGMGMMKKSVTDVNGQVTATTYSYDSAGNGTVNILAPGETGSFTTQTTFKSSCTASSSLPCMEADSQSSLYPNAVTRKFYDSQGRLVETLLPGPDASHTTVKFTVNYDQTNSVFESLPFVVAARTTWLDPNGATDDTGATPAGTMTVNDAVGRVISTTDPLGHVSKKIYGLGAPGVNGDSKIYVKTVGVDANNHVMIDYADTLVHTVYTIEESGTYGGTLTPNQVKAFQFNALDKPTTVTTTDLAPQSGQTVTSVTATSDYDDTGQVIKLVDPDRGTHVYTYNANGKLIGDVSGSRTLGTNYDLLERTGCQQDALPTPDVHGACSSGAHPLVQNTYDADPNGVSWGSTNYAVGRLTQSVASTYYPAPDNAVGTVTKNTQYDQRGRVITERIQVAISGGTLAFPNLPLYQKQLSYNNDNQVTATQTSVDGQPGYAFTQVYDSTTGMITGISNSTTAVANLARLTYNAQALISDITYKDSAGNDLATTHLAYDGAQRLTQSTTTWQNGGGTIYSDSVLFDAVGNAISRATSQAAVSGVNSSGGNEVQNFCYDEQNRMVWASNTATATPGSSQSCGTTAPVGTIGGGYTTNYAYTNLGQLFQGPLNGTGAQEQYLYCDSAHPHQVTALVALSTAPTCSTTSTKDYSASYDTFGNMTTRTTAGKAGTQTYDVLDHLVRWNNAAGAQKEWYLYDADGTRVLRSSSDGTTTKITVYAWGLEEHSYAYAGTGSTASPTGHTYYYTLSDQLLGSLSGTSVLTTNFLLEDSLGSIVSSITNTAGTAAVQGNQLYGPYGNKRYTAGDVGTSKGFTGQYNDDVTGLDYYGARYYDPYVGRFISADTKQGDMQGMDPYDYVGGNPETHVDKDGHCWPLCTMAIGAVIGAVAGAGISIATQAISSGHVDWGEVGKQAVVGAISGAVSGLAGPEAGPLVQAAVGAASGAAGQMVNNALSGKPLGDGVLEATVTGGLTGGLMGGVGHALTGAAAPAQDAVTAVQDTATSLTKTAATNAAADTADTVADTSAIDTVNADPATSTQTVTYSRVQGGVRPNASRYLIFVNEDGSITIPDKSGNLNVSVGNDHAAYFQTIRGENSQVVQFDLPKWFDDFVQESAIEQYGYRSNPLNQGGTVPKLVDPTTPGRSYEFPSPWIRWIEEHATNGRIIK